MQAGFTSNRTLETPTPRPLILALEQRILFDGAAAADAATASEPQPLDSGNDTGLNQQTTSVLDALAVAPAPSEGCRLAAYMAIITQVRIAQQQLDLAENQFNRTSELDDINQKIHQQVLNSEMADAMSSLERIRISVDSVLSALQKHQAYAESQEALAKLYVSLGFDPLPKTIENDSIDTLASAIEMIDKEWEQGKYPQHAADDPQPVTQNGGDERHS